jgi:ATP-dependent DNA helicase Rep
MTYSELNSQQKEAVNYISGPCLVIAGAGSGKTKVITEKILYLIQETMLKGYEICAVTFTNKAAKEMRARIAKIADHELLKGLLITTFHSLGLHIIKRDYAKMGLKKNFILMDTNDQKWLVSSLYREQLGNKEDKVDDEVVFSTLNAISKAKMNGQTPDEMKMNSSSDEMIHALIYEKYETMMNAYNAVDFDDLVLKPMRLLKTNESSRKYWQNRFKHVLVDEYQDTNETQYEFLKLLIGLKEKFTFVGDDDQSIYAWRGADPQNIVRLHDDFPNLKVIKLEQNYRSCGRILHVANELIKNNSHIISKNLFSNYMYGDRIIVHESSNPVAEAQYVSTLIYGKRYEKKLKWKNFGVLYRTNFQSREIEKNFRESRIPYRINGDISFFERAEVKDIMAYYRVLQNPQNDNAIIRIINIPPREIGNATTEKLGQYAKENGMSLFDAMDYYDFTASLSERAANALKKFKTFIKAKREMIDEGLEEDMIQELFDEINYRNYLVNENKNEQIAQIKYENIIQLRDWLIKKLKGNPSEAVEPSSFDDAVSSLCLREMLDQTGDDTELDQVQLMTIHAAKGLEFDFVFIIGCEEKIIPHNNSIENGEIEEERRLMYVGITRAKKYLIMSHCRSRQDEKTKISRFIKELPQDDLDIQTIESQKKADLQTNLDFLNSLLAD